MFHEVDQALRALLAPRLPHGTGISFEQPVGAGAGGTAPAPDPHVVLFLYDVREDPSGRGAGWAEVRDARRRVVSRHLPHRRYQLSYLITTQAARAEDAHRLLGGVLASLVNRDALPPDTLNGSLADAQLPVELRVAPPVSTAAAWELLAALRLSPRACLELVVTAPLIPDLVIGVPDPADTVTFGLSQLHDAQGRATDQTAPPANRTRHFTTVRIRERGHAGPSTSDTTCHEDESPQDP